MTQEPKITVFAFRDRVPSIEMIRQADYAFTIKGGKVEQTKDRGLEVPSNEIPVVITAERLRSLEASDRRLVEIWGSVIVSPDRYRKLEASEGLLAAMQELHEDLSRRAESCVLLADGDDGDNAVRLISKAHAYIHAAELLSFELGKFEHDDASGDE